jgi:hypothetical protein
MSTKSQNLDQALKGGALGVWVYLAAQQGLDSEVVAVLTPAIAYGLAWLSTKIGDPTVASFLTKKAAPAPKKKA